MSSVLIWEESSSVAGEMLWRLSVNDRVFCQDDDNYSRHLA
jgi:hypothetical protein